LTCLLVGQVIVKNDTLWKQYVNGVSKSLEPFNALILFRGQKSQVLAGENPTDLIVTISFEIREEIDVWFNSDLYQKLIPLRDEAADVIITTYV